MPTGHTADMYDGKPVTFREFALSCARSFGALVHMRDDDMKAKIKKREPSDYYKTSIEDAIKRLDHVARMSNDDASYAAYAEYQQAMARYEESVKTSEKRRETYSKMLDKIEAWNPPTPEHDNLKAFMREQIEDSIKFDCHIPVRPKRQSAVEWRKSEIECAAPDIAYSRKSLAEEEQRCDDANAWVDALIDSLPED